MLKSKGLGYNMMNRNNFFLIFITDKVYSTKLNMGTIQMAKDDILTYNSASKGFETALNDNTAQIQGDGTKIFSIESGSDTLLSVGTSKTSIVFNSNI